MSMMCMTISWSCWRSIPAEPEDDSGTAQRTGWAPAEHPWVTADFTGRTARLPVFRQPGFSALLRFSGMPPGTLPGSGSSASADPSAADSPSARHGGSGGARPPPRSARGPGPGHRTAAHRLTSQIFLSPCRAEISSRDRMPFFSGSSLTRCLRRRTIRRASPASRRAEDGEDPSGFSALPKMATPRRSILQGSPPPPFLSTARPADSIPISSPGTQRTGSTAPASSLFKRNKRRP